MSLNLSVNSHLLAVIAIIVVLAVGGVFGYDFYKMTRPDFKNVVYSDISKANKLDIYIPKTGTAPYPVVVWIHGGSFKSGSKYNPRSLDRLLEEGFAVVSINYRLSKEAKWPAQLTDLENVVKFIKTNAEKYTFNKDKIATWGEDAGGYLSSIAVLALGQNPETKIQAGVDWYGPKDFFTMDEDIDKAKLERSGGKVGEENSPESKLLGVPVKDNKEKADAASVLTYARQYTSAPSPLLIMHGKLDTVVGFPQAENLRNIIQGKFGIGTIQLELLPKGTHGGGDFKKKESEDIVVNFLKKYLK